MIERLRERPGKLLPMLLFAAVAALAWWLILLTIGVAEIVVDPEMDSSIGELLDAVSFWFALAGLLVVPVATLVWSSAIRANAGATAAGIAAAFIAFLIAAVPIYFLWMLLYYLITGNGLLA